MASAPIPRSDKAFCGNSGIACNNRVTNSEYLKKNGKTMASNEYRANNKTGGAVFSSWWPQDYAKTCRGISPADVDSIINNVATDWLLMLEIKPEGYPLPCTDGQYKTLRMFSSRQRQASLVAWMEDDQDNILDEFEVGHFNGGLNRYRLSLEDFQELMVEFCRKDQEPDIETFLITHCKRIRNAKYFRLITPEGRDYFRVDNGIDVYQIDKNEYEDLQDAA